jgi:hypothetical protein
MPDELLQITLLCAAIAFICFLALYLVSRQQGHGKTGRSAGGIDPGQRKPPSSVRAGSGERANWLVGIGGEVASKTYHIGSRTVTLGRGVGNYVQITDNAASPVHCRLNPTPAGCQVTDLNSENGTFVNDEQITNHVLHEGDELRVGEARFLYRLKADYQKDDGLAGKSVK